MKRRKDDLHLSSCSCCVQHLLPGEGVQQHDQQSRDVDRPGAGGGDYIFLALRISVCVCAFCFPLCVCDYQYACRRFFELVRPLYSVYVLLVVSDALCVFVPV